MTEKRDLIDKRDPEQIWALMVRQSYNFQLENGRSEPRITDFDLYRMTSASESELGRLGLKLAAYRDAVYIEPESRYPRRGEEELLSKPQLEDIANG